MKKLGYYSILAGLFVFLLAGGFLLLSYFRDYHSQAAVTTAKPMTEQIALQKVSDKSFKAARTFLVSDIHGRFDSFKKALAVVKFSKADQLFVLGDTIDRGPAGFHALLYLTQTLPATGYHVTVLTGNHEDMWLPMASDGATDAQQLANLKQAIAQYGTNVPNGWAESEAEWIKLSATERAFLLKEMANGFGEPRELIIKVNDKWLSLSHSADFSKPINQQTAWDLSWNNKNMRNAPATFRQSFAAKMQVPIGQTQVFIGHISNILFGINPEFVDLDDTIVRTDIKGFDAVPVQIFCLNDQKFYQ